MDYDPETGAFTWKWHPDMRPAWNARYPERTAGCQAKIGYTQVRINDVLYYAHRLAWLYVHGEWPPHEIDHRDTNKTNNAIHNLRKATREENNCNMSQKNTRHPKGASFHSLSGLWLSRITFQKRNHFLGYYRTPEEAHAAYRKAAQKLHGEFANFGNAA